MNDQSSQGVSRYWDVFAKTHLVMLLVFMPILLVVLVYMGLPENTIGPLTKDLLGILWAYCAGAGTVMLYYRSGFMTP